MDYRRQAAKLALITTGFVALSIAFTFVMNTYAHGPGLILALRIVQIVALVAFAVFFFRRILRISNAQRQQSTRTDSFE